jgi:streptomycin 6-kinase
MFSAASALTLECRPKTAATPAHTGGVLVVPQTVRRKAELAGAGAWVDDLAALIGDVERDWSITVGRAFANATEAFVAEAVTTAGEAAVLKLVVPREGDPAAAEITALRLADGDGCARLLRSDASRGALLLERLGRPMSELRLPLRRRHELLCDLATRIWRPAPDSGLPTGAQKGRWLCEFIVATWEALDRPVPERTVAHALACAERRIAAHDDARAMLVHGDVHQWNALQFGSGFALVDPDGLLAEPEYDLAIIMREDPLELLLNGPRARAAWLADRTGRDIRAIWEWGVVERVSTGLLAVSVGLQPVGDQMLHAADVIAATKPA